MGISRAEAERRLREFLTLRATDGKEDLGPLELQDFEGEWIAFGPRYGVRIEHDKGPIVFGGALGKLVPFLGLPTTSERHLGSTWFGRYQAFERGMGIWEVSNKQQTDEPDLPPLDVAYPIFMGDGSPKPGENLQALVAFFDLRGFTNWSHDPSVGPELIQETISTLEQAFQGAFDPDAPGKIFAKGTGDGFMVVCEGSEPESLREHARAFCRSCAKTVSATSLSLRRNKLDRKLAIGCGITCGKVTRVYILGRFDYLGGPVNTASKIQSVAYNELCIADEVMTLLNVGGHAVDGIPIAGKGLRVAPDALLRS
jgi:class 3 adenylate cyclase